MMMVVVVTCTHCIGFSFNLGAGLTVGNTDCVYGGIAHSFIFDKNLLDGQPMDSAIQILIGYREAVFGYGCVLKYHPEHTREKFEVFDSIMSVGYNIMFTDFMSTMISFILNTRNELGFSVIWMFNIDPYIY